MSRTMSGNDPRAPGTAAVFLRLTPDQRRRLRVAAAEEDTSYAGLIMALLDERDAKIARIRAAQPSPLHRPRTPFD